MSRKLHRRDFVKGTAGVGVWAGVAARESKAANEQIAFGCIGVGGQGGSDSASANKASDVVAICDVDDNTLGGASKRYAKAQKFNDYRKMLDKMGKSLDAVTVSTPDHTHAPAAIRSQVDLHCSCVVVIDRTTVRFWAVFVERIVGCHVVLHILEQPKPWPAHARVELAGDREHGPRTSQIWRSIWRRMKQAL